MTTRSIAAHAALSRQSSSFTLLAMLALCGAVARQRARPVRRRSVQPETVHEVRLSINSRDNRELASASAEHLLTRDSPGRVCGCERRVRNRGLGSRNPTSPGSALTSIATPPVRVGTFLGLRSLILDNNWQDPSFLANARRWPSSRGSASPRRGSRNCACTSTTSSGPLLNRRIGRYAIPLTYLRQRSGVSLRVPVSAGVAWRLSRRRAGGVQAILPT